MLLVLMITSKGMAGVPRASLVVIAAIMPMFKIPEAGLLLILAVDHFLDMGRSGTNVVGNAVAASVIARWEGTLDTERSPRSIHAAPLRTSPKRRSPGITSDMLSVGGIELLPPLARSLVCAAGLALNIVPGADMTFVIASAARAGAATAWLPPSGSAAGTLVHMSPRRSACPRSSPPRRRRSHHQMGRRRLPCCISRFRSLRPQEAQSEDAARPARPAGGCFGRRYWSMS